jgi:hypothetical protein
MAERRMFAKTIIDSDAFLDMPLSTQALYFHLSMRADDDGFLNNPKKIMRMIGASQNELELLLGKKFLIAFESGVVVIKHGKIHNYIRSDRYKETKYIEEKGQLSTKKNGSYTLGIPDDNRLVYQMETQVRLGKDSISKNKEYSAFFAQMWELYPIKRGKAQVSKSKQKEIYEHKDEFEKAIQRYLSYVETRRKEGFDLKYQNGSTFFNSGYVDYLDENYQEYIPKKKSAKPNTFHNYTDSEKLSEEELEKMLLKK